MITSEREDKATDSAFKAMMAETFLNLQREIDLHI